MPLIRGGIIFILIAVFSTVKAQVIGVDTTGERYKYDEYGFNTVSYYTEEDFFRNDTIGRKVDSTRQDFREVYYQQGSFEPYQDLGTIGSPQKPYFYKPEEEIGVELGMNTLDRYAFQHEEIPFFDTRSPFSQLMYNRTFEFQESIDATFSRSIDERSGAGFRFRRMAGSHTFGTNSSQVPYADHYSAYINGFYMTKNRRLKLLGSYRWFNQTVVEDGGVLISDTEDLQSNPFENNSLSQLYTQSLRTQDRRNGWHFTGLYSLLDTAGTLNAFYSFDRLRRVNYYIDTQHDFDQELADYSNRDYYQQLTGDPAAFLYTPGNIKDSTILDRLEHKAGLSGYAKGLQYSVYIKLREYNFYRNDSLITGAFYEQFAGGDAGYKFNEDFFAHASLESGTSDQYLLKADISLKWVNLKYHRSSRVPSIIQQQFLGMIYQWSNDFRNKEEEQIKVGLNLDWKYFRIKPFYEIASVNHAIYYDSQARPVQHNSTVTSKAVGTEFYFDWRHIHLTSFFKNFTVNGFDLYRAPENYVYARLAFDARFFERKLNAQFGLEMTYRSAFDSKYYMPYTQQYYINTEEPFRLKDYTVVDFFISGEVKNFLMYVKLNHLNQGYSGDGYYMAPYYPGVKRSFEMGVNWKFYK